MALIVKIGNIIAIKIFPFCNCMNRHADKNFDVLVSTGTSEGDKSLKVPSDSISQGVIFQTFLEGMSPDPLVWYTLRACELHTLYESTYSS